MADQPDAPTPQQPTASGTPEVSRRTLLALGTAAVAGLGLTGLLAPPATGQQSLTTVTAGDGQTDVIANAFGFAVDIPGCRDASKNIREVQIDELTIDQRETTTGVDVGLATFIFAASPVVSAQIGGWFDKAARGQCTPRNISITLFKAGRVPGRSRGTLKAGRVAGRSYRLYDCFPVEWSTVNFDTSSTVQTETIKVKVGRIEFKT